MFNDCVTDIRAALRALVRERSFFIVAILTLGVGIGATTALFSMVDAVLLRPLPWASAERLVRIEERRGGQPGRVRWTVTNGVYNAWRDSHEVVDDIAAWRSTGQTLSGAGEAERIVVTAATPSLFPLLGVQPIAGRPFVEADAEIGADAVAILSFGFWQQRFGGHSDVIGRRMRLDEREYEIVGVMPPAFAFPDRDTRVWLPFQPLPLLSADGRQLRVIVVEAIAKLRHGISAAQAAAEASARAETVADIRQAALSVFGATGEVSVAVMPVREALTEEVRPALVLLLAAVTLLLSATVANVVSMQMARSTARKQEAAIRAAIGAGSWRLTRLWLVESAVVGTSAAVAGIALAAILVAVMPAWMPADVPRLDEIAIGWRSLGFAFSVTVLVAVMCATLPALFARSHDIARDLAGHGAGHRGSASRGIGTRIQAVLVVGQVSAACALLTGGTLLTRSFVAMLAADRGYDPTNVLTARLTFPHNLPGAQRTQLLESLQERLQVLPHVSQVAFGNGVPLLAGGINYGRYIPAPHDPSVSLHISATWRTVSPNYLEALRSRIVQGRPLRLTDTLDTPRVVVVNRSFAAEYLGPEPIGVRLELGLSSGREWTVVGVTDDIRPGPLSDRVAPEFFVSTRQAPESIAFDPVLLVRSDDEPVNHAAAVRALVRELTPLAAVDSISTMEDRVRRSLGRPRAYAVVFGALSILSLAICAVGVFGLLSYITASRTQEIGVRLAIGAAPRQVASLVVRQALALLAAGLTLGLGVTWFMAESMSRFVYGITTRDAASFAVAPVVLTAIGIIAAFVPARNAARLDPLRVLRSN